MWSLLFPLNSLMLAVWCLACGSCLIRPVDQESTAKTLYVQLFVGMSAFYLCVMAGIDLHLLCLAIYATLPVALFLRGKEILSNFRNSDRSIIHLSILALPFLLFLFIEPIRNGDALAIWFLHGKMIYLGQHLGNAIGFERGLAIGYDAHMDYPKLVAALSAMVATFNGFWNEYLPKSALTALLLLAILGLSATTVISKTAKVMLLTVWFPLSLYRGFGQFMDYWLAMFTLLSILYLIEYKVRQKQIDLLCFLASALCLTFLKNEGLTICAILVFLALALTNRRNLFDYKTWISSGKGLLVILPIGSIVIWSIRKQMMGIHVDLDFLSKTAAIRAISRMDIEHIGYFLYYIFSFNQGSLVFSVAAGIATYLACKKAHPLSSPYDNTIMAGITCSVSFCALYFTLLTWIYFTTYHDFVWHLDTSADRVVLPILLVSFVPLALIWTQREQAARGNTESATSTPRGIS